MGQTGGKMKSSSYASIVLVLLATSCSFYTKPKQSEKLDDNQIVEIMLSVDKLEIAAADVALQKQVTNPVRDFARYLKDEHQASSIQLTQLAQQMEIQPQESCISRTLKTNQDQLVEKLSKLNGPEFDRVYVQEMIKSHQDGLVLIDTKLYPQTKNAELKKFVEKFRAMVQRHLERGLEVQKNL